MLLPPKSCDDRHAPPWKTVRVPGTRLSVSCMPGKHFINQATSLDFQLALLLVLRTTHKSNTMFLYPVLCESVWGISWPAFSGYPFRNCPTTILSDCRESNPRDHAWCQLTPQGGFWHRSHHRFPLHILKLNLMWLYFILVFCTQMRNPVCSEAF